ncbi:MAG: NYN domain-containing protein [Verrucomicrobia bacterium]|nr:NYN domain-containing protein [Verrucomicrobiota bacterium]
MDPPPRFLIVDGHSIIHVWDDLRKLHLRAASRYLAREELLKRMRLLQDMTTQRVVVVFDGTQSQLTDERETNGIQVFYADAGKTADSVIERLAAKYARQFELRICTADRMIWETVRAFEAHWMSPDDLKYELEKAEGKMRGKIKR